MSAPERTGGAYARHRLTFAGKTDLRTHRLGGHPGIGREPNGIGTEPLAVADNGIGQNSRIQGVVRREMPAIPAQ